MKNQAKLMWQRNETKAIVVSKSDGTELLGLMVTSRTLKRVNPTQLIGSTLIDHVVVCGQKFSRPVGLDIFCSESGEQVELKRLA
ncbi:MULTISPECIES: hypothetical protein [Acinetobacter calcoaceticus/baumannii complex]|uniref:hypothetical protein n=1 Tax=Acinetobacter calcoaceticus/baumannii complex TaxID=909768 RepID=UPI0007071D41|nr:MULTISPECIES: hypothetical protein [Acinetobacter calcoaceticus/baumannii complex]KQE86337.1 hypothetical protein APB94_16390 [Acinetobacter lactucae]